MAVKNKYAHAAALIIMGEEEHVVQERYRFDSGVMYEIVQASEALEEGDHERFHMLIQNLTKLYGS